MGIAGDVRKGRGGEGPKLGTYVPQRVAKLSRAISRLQKRNEGGGKSSAGGMGEVEKETRKRRGRRERKEKEKEGERKRPAEAREKGHIEEGRGGERGREEMAMESICR